MSNPRETVISKAMKDPAYRKRLLTDPEAAITELGLKLPKGAKVKVVEDAASVVHLVLPPASKGAISDSELQKVSGGIMPTYAQLEGDPWDIYRVC